MRRNTHLALLVGLVCWAGLLFGAQAAGKTQVELIFDTATAAPGSKVWAGVKFTIPAHWHIYWRNPGTTGIATEINWKDLPPEIKPGPIHWPVPTRRLTQIAGTDEVSYDYEGELLLLIPLEIGAGTAAGDLEIKASVTWLECKTDGACVPGNTKIAATLKIGDVAQASTEAAEFAAWRKKLPIAADSQTNARALWDGPGDKDERPLVIEWTPTASAPAPDYYPYEDDAISVHPISQALGSTDGVLRLRKNAFKLGDTWPASIKGLFLADAKGQPFSAMEVTLAVGDSTGTIDTSATSPTPTAATSPAAVPEASFLRMLFYAFLGGLILNIMPCVLPVIALKILGFVNQSKEDPRRVFHMGLIYAVGVVFSFLILAGLIIAVKQAGSAAGWGMQFANPKFLVGMTVLVTLVALNLFGLFEVTLGGGAMGAAGELASKEGPAGAFFQGMLATALATPCTAPFLAPALGFAFAQSAGVIVLMFVTIALGLAFPYVVLSWQPAWLRFLPKPGVWMQHFKVAMGFPMLATTIWLFWLTIKHYGRDGVLWFGSFLVVVALTAWIWGQFVQRGSGRKGLSVAISLALLIGGYAYAMEGQLQWREARQPDAAPTAAANELGPPLTADGRKVDWKPWSKELIAKAQAAGRPVLVDFTAEWCLTCNLNKKTSIEIDSVKQKLVAINAVPLKGDHTLQPPSIQAELQRFGRAGVPLVLVYSADPAKAPLVLPEALTPGIVLDALEQASARP